ncbi:MAG: hypothetical protein EBY16_02960 [Gammaproteobacteria bacterium]|nr:hypothetical protein [Gammaproteobacteria bacterium]
MRIQLNNQNQFEEDPDIIIHGNKPRAAAQSCNSCGRKNNCLILQTTLQQMQVLAPMPSGPGRMYKNNQGIWVHPDPVDIQVPMPCRGDAWMPRGFVGFENNPLVQRLGLDNIAEPSGYYKEKRENEYES